MEIVSRTAVSGKYPELIKALTTEAGEVYDVAMLFLSAGHKDQLQELVRGISDQIAVGNFIACTCAGIIGSDAELEQEEGAVLFLGSFPGVTCKPFYITQSQLEQIQKPEDYHTLLEVHPNDEPVFFMIPDPFQLDLNALIEGMNEAYGQAPLVGGLASGSNEANGNVLMLNGETYTQGAVGFALTGGLRLHTIVSQGCKPVGEPYIVTKADKNIIHEVAGKSFLDILRQVFLTLDEKERQLMQQALLVGIAMDEYTHNFGRGDFLVRPVIGIDQNTGAVGIGDRIQTGQTIQLHLRDARTATEDLSELLQTFRKKHSGDLHGALVFSCNGRGEGLFGEPNHDIQMIQKILGPVPAAGFFCAGEIGPIGGKNFIHGFTDSIAVFSSD